MSTKKRILICVFLTTFSLFAAEPYPVLKDVFKNHFLLGCAIHYSDIDGTNPIEQKLFLRNFNSLTTTMCLKWRSVHPDLSTYDFSISDNYVNFAVKNKLFVVGHTLVWHKASPDWIFVDKNGKELSRDSLLKRMEDHIKTVVGRYKGKIASWDVVNEAIADDGTYRQSKWFKIIGEEFIEKAFEFAHKADPKAELYYNDYALWRPAKREGVIKMIKRLQAKNIPIHGVNEQGHYYLTRPSIGELDATIKDLSKLGIPISISELDLSVLPRIDNLTGDIADHAVYNPAYDPYKQGLPDSLITKFSKRYGQIFKVFKDNSSVIKRVTFWNLTDETSWLNDFPMPGRTNYPLLFDRNKQPKLEAINEIIKQFR